MLTLGEKLRLARESKGLTQKAVADLAGIARETVVRIELGINEPKFSTVEKILACLGISSFDQLETL